MSIVREHDGSQERDPQYLCSIPGCPEWGRPPITCVCWGHRLCYPHYADLLCWLHQHGRVEQAASSDPVFEMFVQHLPHPRGACCHQAAEAMP